MTTKTIAIDLGGTSAQLALINDAFEIEHRWQVRTDTSDEGMQILPHLITSIQQTLTERGLDHEQIRGIGMGTPGKVDNDQGTVQGAYNLGWKSVQPVRQLLEEALNLPVQLDNDANIAALGEQWQGAGQRAANVVMVTLGTGVGGGIVIDHRLYHGTGLVAGEIGHLPIEPQGGILCTCGNVGCLETVASATGIVNLANRHIDEFAEFADLREQLAMQQLSAKDIFDLAQAGNAFGLKIFDEYTNYLSTAVAIIANLLNPAKIVLGGGVAQAGNFLLETVQKKAQRAMYPPSKTSTEIVLAQLGDDAALYGAVRLVLQRED